MKDAGSPSGCPGSPWDLVDFFDPRVGPSSRAFFRARARGGRGCFEWPFPGYQAEIRFIRTEQVEPGSGGSGVQGGGHNWSFSETHVGSSSAQQHRRPLLVDSPRRERNAPGNRRCVAG